MAKLKGPLFSLGATQQLGKSLVFFGWKGLDVVREYVIPANPRTTLQNTQRGYLTEAVSYIHQYQANPAEPLGPTDVTAYALLASVVQSATTWFNQAVRDWVRQRVAGLTGEIFFFGSTTPGAGQLAVDGRHAPTVCTAGDFWYGTSKTALIHTQVAVVVPGGQSATIAGLTSGVKYFWQFRPTAPAAVVGTRSGIYYGYPT